jgi:hypothetical protein
MPLDAFRIHVHKGMGPEPPFIIPDEHCGLKVSQPPVVYGPSDSNHNQVMFDTMAANEHDSASKI